MKNKKGFELAVSTIILLILGILLLVLMISFLVSNWSNFSDKIKGYFGSEEQNAHDLCENQCNLIRDYDFCCSEKTIKNEELTCVEFNVSCNNINCEEVNCI